LFLKKGPGRVLPGPDINSGNDPPADFRSAAVQAFHEVFK
jgi:hypothetical protein